MRVMRLGTGVVICFLYAITCARAEQLPITTYTAADGLAQNLVLKIIRDSHGYLWFCTAEGLSRFDGYSFTNYSTDNGLPHRSVRHLLETRDGNYWIATGDGLVRFIPNALSSPQHERMFSTYRADDTAARNVMILYEDRSGTIWCGTHNGLYRLHPQNDRVEFEYVRLGPTERGQNLVEAILEDREGSLWVGTRGNGLYRRAPGGALQHYSTSDGLPVPRINDLLQDRQGRIWVATSLGLCVLTQHQGNTTRVSIRVYQKGVRGLEYNWVQALYESSDGRLWAALAGGLTEILPATDAAQQRFKTYDARQGLSHLDLTSLAEDNAGNLWIGATSGAMKFARSGLFTYKNVGADGIFESKDGDVCLIRVLPETIELAIATNKRGELSFIRPRFPPTVRYFGFGWNQIGLQDRQGDVWLATGEGLARFQGIRHLKQLAKATPTHFYTTQNGLKANLVWRLFEDRRGDIWIGTASNRIGVTRWERATSTFHHYTQNDGLPSEGWVQAIGEDAQGDIWLGVANTLLRYRNGGFQPVTTIDGPRGGINAIHLDLLGRLWIGMDTGGLLRTDNADAEVPVFKRYANTSGLSSNQVLALTSDQHGDVYVFTGRGLDYLNATTGTVTHFTMAEGLAGGAPKAALRDKHGLLWFATDRGISTFNPQAYPAPQPHVPVLISRLFLGGDQYAISELGQSEVPEIQLGPGESQVQIDFVGLNFIIGQKLKYQYKLEGIDRDWSAPSEQRSVNYARLSPGRYRFLVRALRSDGTTSASPASVSFVILPPVWQRWWFVTAVSVAVMLLAYALYRYRVTRLLEIERIRTRIATDLHDDIGSNLSLIAMVSEVANRQTRSERSQLSAWLTLISNTSRETVDSMSDIVWAINPAKDRVSDLIQRMRRLAADILGPRHVEFSFKAPEQKDEQHLGADTRREVFMIFKEALNNVARHSACTNVAITIAIDDRHLQLVIEDNGKGFDLTAPPTGNGVVSMRRRAARLKADLAIISTSETGTVVQLKLPLHGSKWPTWRPALLKRLPR
jgi:ligand-binding sensor domain-containing protein/signal transduction histidine kinase